MRKYFFTRTKKRKLINFFLLNNIILIHDHTRGRRDSQLNWSNWTTDRVRVDVELVENRDTTLSRSFLVLSCWLSFNEKEKRWKKKKRELEKREQNSEGKSRRKLEERNNEIGDRLLAHALNFQVNKFLLICLIASNKKTNLRLYLCEN